MWSSDVWPTDVWIADLTSGTAQRLTTDGNDNNEPQWSPDGQSIAFDADLIGRKDIYVKALGSDSTRLLTRLPRNQFPSDWASDGSAILFEHPGGESEPDVWSQPMDGGAARPLLTGPGLQGHARVSPDARWVAYVSSETGRNEVYLQTYPTLGRKTLVSEGGGSDPAWRRDGRELYYWHGDELIAVSLTFTGAGESPVVGTGTPLFQTARVNGAGYDVSPDGTQFVFVAGGPRATRLVVALGALDTDRQR